MTSSIRRRVSGFKFIEFARRNCPRNTRNTQKLQSRWFSFRVFRVFRGQDSPVAFPHHEIERAEDRDDIGDQAADADLRQDREIAERWCADLQAIRHAAALA